MERRLVTTPDGLALAVWTDGAQRAPATVVLGHGYAQAHGCWHHQVSALVAAGFRVITWDLRGHGESGHPTSSRATIDDAADDLALVVEQCAPAGPLVLVGHSMGAMALLELASRHPAVLERAVAVALLATSTDGDDLGHLGLPSSWTPWLQRVGERVFGALAHLPRATRIVGATRPVLDPVVRLLCCGRGTSREDVARTRQMALAAGFHTMADFLPALRAHHRAPALPLFVGKPVLVLNGSADLVIPPSASAGIAAALPGCRHVVVEGAGHNVMLAAPSEVTAELLALARGAVS